MSSDDREVMISVRGLSKAYTIAHANQRATTLGEAAMRRLRSPFRREERETFWALQDVSFDVRRGDVVGVIGRNGAGKSTLFKVLSRITEPTGGAVDLYGRVGSLLEVGTGFSGELTGRENIFLNGTILGMSRPEVAKRFDEIVAFSGVEKFLDTPVKRYSSGMYVRLAFAVAAHLESEILIVDEVLAVGDAEFQNKCLGKMRSVAKSGRAILFVSHNLASITSLCNAGLALRAGRIESAGAIRDVVGSYLEEGQRPEKVATFARRVGAPCWISKLVAKPELDGGSGGWDCAGRLLLRIEFHKIHPGIPLEVSIRLEGASGAYIFTSFASRGRINLSDVPPGIYSITFKLSVPNLVPGRYAWSAWLHDPMRELYDYRESAITTTVVNSSINFARLGSADSLGALLMDADQVVLETISGSEAYEPAIVSQ